MGMRVIMLVRRDAGRQVEAFLQQKGRIDRAVDRRRDRRRAQRAEAVGQRGRRGVVREVGLGQDDAVGERDLMTRLRGMIEVAGAARRIDHRDQPLQVEDLAERAVAGDGLQHWAGIGEAAGLDDDALEARHRAAAALGEQGAQAFLQIGAHRAADAAIAEQHRRIAARA
jgi:hypothetical protein